MKTKVRFNSIGLKALVVVVLALMLQPLAYLFIRASEKSASEVLTLLTRQKTLDVLVITLSLLVIVVVSNVVLGTAMAAGLHYVKIPYPRLFLVASILPLAIPSYVFTYTWKALFPSLQGLWAGAFILALSTMPYMILTVLIAFQKIDLGIHL